MMNIRKRLKEQKGETITEVLVALLVVALGVIAASGAIISSSRSMTKAETKMKDYYRNVNLLEDGSLSGKGQKSEVTITAEDGVLSINGDVSNGKTTVYWSEGTFADEKIYSYAPANFTHK